MRNFFGKKIALLSIFLFTCIAGYTQGLHFSYLEFAPQSVNPGLIGGFSGSYRAAVLYRDQWNIAQDKGYKTFELGVDAPIIRGFRKQDWIGAGISIDIDQRGSLNLKDRYSRIGASYHFSLNKKQTSIITLGIQMYGQTRSLNAKIRDLPYTSPFTIESRIAVDPLVEEILRSADPESQKVSVSANDWAGGLVYTNKGKNTGFKLGISSTSIFKPRLSLAKSGSLNELPFKMIGFASFYNQINKKISIEPLAFFQTTKFGNEFMANAKVGYYLKPNSNDKVKAGLGFRTGTASAIFYAGGQIKGIDFGISYDLPFNGYADAQGVQNAFEIGVSYIGLIKKTPKPTPIILCPRL